MSENPAQTQADVIPALSASTSGADRIGRYQIIKTLGEGSFGTVKLAYHMATHARVALKIINRKTLAKSDMQGRVEREISYLRLLRHPHIIKLYDVIKSKDEIIMVIEFAGKELFDYIVHRGRMNEDEARRFFQQIVSAVDYCHRHKIVHRDLKPENLLLDDNLNVKIADFGLSNIMTDGNFLKTSCGSPNYAAPEVISGKLYAGPEVDVWSCGVILYVMLCGRLPFDDEFIPNLFKKISNGVYSIPPNLSPGAKNLLQRMLVVNPLDRTTLREIIQDPWFSVNLDPALLPLDMREEQERKKEEKSASDSIDDSLVGALARTMGYSKEQIYEALRHTSGNGSEIRDAYQIVKDNKMMGSAAVRNSDIDKYLSEDTSTEEARLKQAQQLLAKQKPATLPSNSNPGSQQPSPALAAVGTTGSHPSLSRDNPAALTFDRMQFPSGLDGGSHHASHNTIAVLPTSLPTYHRANMLEYGPSTMRRINPLTTKKPKTRWHFGIRSRSYPLDVMGEIYRALKNLGAEWAVPSEEDLWTIQVRWKCVLPQPGDPSGDSSGSQDTGAAAGTETATPNNTKMDLDETREQIELMKMRIQLYQIEQNNYLVDFKFDGWEDVQTKSAQPKTVRVPPSLQMATPGAVSGTAAAKAGAAGVCRDRSEFDTFSVYPFLHLATRLIMELAVNSQGQ